MSRSYKKHPYCGDCKTVGKWFANRRVRRYKGMIHKGKAYRKVYDTWSVCDYYSKKDFQTYLKHAREVEQYKLSIGKKVKLKMDKDYYREWYKYYKAK